MRHDRALRSLPFGGWAVGLATKIFSPETARPFYRQAERAAQRSEEQARTPPRGRRGRGRKQEQGADKPTQEQLEELEGLFALDPEEIRGVVANGEGQVAVVSSDSSDTIDNRPSSPNIGAPRVPLQRWRQDLPS